MDDFVGSLKEQVAWDCIKPWLLPAAGTVLAAYLAYKAVKILRTDCDLTLMSKRLKAGYFNGKVVWVTGASSGSKFFSSTRTATSSLVPIALSLHPSLPHAPALRPSFPLSWRGSLL